MEQVARLHLKRPLVFFDLETTGTKVGVDRIVDCLLYTSDAADDP
mgnify:CR=1 FL=1